MPPKTKITKEKIVKTALAIVRSQGEAALNARRIAAELDCSTQPIFSNFTTMEELRAAVVSAATTIFDDCIQEEMQSGKYPEYKASGMAYIRFAGAEKELFKLLFMRDRTAEVIAENDSTAEPMFAMVQSTTGFERDEAKRFHLEMWLYVHGIATMIATNYLIFDTALISDLLTDAFIGLKKRYEEKE